MSRFPLAALILRPDATIEFANAVVARSVAGGWLAGAARQLAALAEQRLPSAMLVTAPGGSQYRAMVYAAAVGNRIVVVLDPERRATGSAQVLALHRRILDLERNSLIDPLTGLWNRRHYDHVVSREIHFSEDQLCPLSLAVLDLDHLQRINERHGHGVGDDILRLAAVRLRGACRPTDVLFRWGGDEFALLMPATSAAAGAAVAERLRARLALTEMPLAGFVTATAGVGEHDAGESPEHWSQRVDEALLRAKEHGGDRVAVAHGGASAAWRAQRAESALRLVWSEEMVCGNDLIDDQHRALFHASNALMASLTDERVPRAEILEQVDCLLSAIARHFADEEAVLAEARYPDLAAHAALHRELLEGARKLRGHVQSGRSTPGEVVEFLAYEIVNRHILRADREYFAHFARGAAAT